MAGFIDGVDRGQSVLFPNRLDDWINEDSLVRVVDLFVDELYLPRLGFTRSAPARSGRPGGVPLRQLHPLLPITLHDSERDLDHHRLEDRRTADHAASLIPLDSNAQARPVGPSIRTRTFKPAGQLLRKAAERTKEVVWRRIGSLLDHFTPQECENYIRNSGYGSV